MMRHRIPTPNEVDTSLHMKAVEERFDDAKLRDHLITHHAPAQRTAFIDNIYSMSRSELIILHEVSHEPSTR